MGNFYTNITLKGASQQRVAERLRQAERSAYVSPELNGCVVVYDEECEEQDLGVLARLVSGLSKDLECAALAVLIHDDDILLYQLCRAGEVVDEYNSCPGYFEDVEPVPPSGGDAVKLCAEFGAAHAAERVASILRKSTLVGDEEYDFEVERHQALSEALGLPSFAVGTGYSSIQEGESPEGLDASMLVKT